MRLKSTYATLVALVILTATPRALDQLADLKNFAQEKFRTELLNIFWSFTTPESRRGSARENAELLARMQASAPGCNDAFEAGNTRAVRATNGTARATTSASDFGHRQPSAADEPSPGNSVADVAVASDEDKEFIDFSEQHTTDAQAKPTLVAWNFKDYPLFDETAVPVAIDDAVAQLDLSRAERSAAPHGIKPTPLLKKDLTNVRRFTRTFVQTSYEFRLPENLNPNPHDIVPNTDAFIKTNVAPPPATPKCRVRVLRVAPEAPPPALEKPAIIS